MPLPSCPAGDQLCQETFDLIANLTKEVRTLEKQVSDMKDDFTGNDNAFFMCSMALIIFCKRYARLIALL